MHGRLKVRTSAEEAARKKKEQELKVKAYRAGMAKIFEKRGKGELDPEMLIITGQILSRNPDVYTLWNIRKEALLQIGVELDASLETDAKQALFDKDLYFSEGCLMVNPKSYGAWHHRCWVLENSPAPNWVKEVQLCTKYLKLDERNFHCWDYRRFVVAKAGVLPQNELDFCTEKIRKNFSNYSSWHYRSKLLPILHPHETEPTRPISEEKLKEELEMVLTAAFTDPNDSSAWFYQRWLLGYSQPELDLSAFRITKDQAVVAFTKAVNLNDYTIKTNLNLELKAWKPLKATEYDNIWTASGEFDLGSAPDGNFEISCEGNGGKFNLDLKKSADGFFGIKCPRFEYEFGAAVLEELKTQLDSCNQLLEFEPDSKWTLLTASLLMRAIDRNGYHAKSLEFLEKLQKIDFLRKGYYEDLASKWTVEKTLEDWTTSQNIPLDLDISNCNLTSICYEQYLCIFDLINLSGNRLTDRSIPKLNAFQFVKNLNISNNALTTADGFPNLRHLKQLTLDGNSFDDDAKAVLKGVSQISL